MSNEKKLGAKLDGWNGPEFPPEIERLQSMYYRHELQNGAHVEKLAASIPGFSRMDRPKTSDGYAWFWALTFELPGGFLQVAFPWSQDWSKRDGTPSDRHAALYTQGEPEPAAMLRILSGLEAKLTHESASA